MFVHMLVCTYCLLDPEQLNYLKDYSVHLSHTIQYNILSSVIRLADTMTVDWEIQYCISKSAESLTACAEQRDKVIDLC